MASCELVELDMKIVHRVGGLKPTGAERRADGGGGGGEDCALKAAVKAPSAYLGDQSLSLWLDRPV